MCAAALGAMISALAPTLPATGGDAPFGGPTPQVDVEVRRLAIEVQALKQEVTSIQIRSETIAHATNVIADEARDLITRWTMFPAQRDDLRPLILAAIDTIHGLQQDAAGIDALNEHARAALGNLRAAAMALRSGRLLAELMGVAVMIDGNDDRTGHAQQTLADTERMLRDLVPRG